MENIVLEVDDNLAKAWRESPPQLKEEFEGKIAELLLELKKREFLMQLDELGRKAQESGLTEEKLNEILNEQDD